MSISKKAAKAITADLDRLAQLFERNHKVIGVPAKVAVDFAYRCDLLSDFVEKNASLDREDQFPDDAVKTESDSDESYVDEDLKEQTYLSELGKIVDGDDLGNAAKLAHLLAELLKTAGDEEGEDDEEEADEEASKKASDDEADEEAEDEDADEEAGKKASDEDADEEADDEEADDEEGGKKAKLVALAREILRVAADDEADDEEGEDEEGEEEASKKAFAHGYDLNA